MEETEGGGKEDPKTMTVEEFKYIAQWRTGKWGLYIRAIAIRDEINIGEKANNCLHSYFLIPWSNNPFHHVWFSPIQK